MDDLARSVAALQDLVDGAGRIVFFGGAGTSTESGIPDFRSADGLYAMDYLWPPEVVISRSFFDAHPSEFYDFYRAHLLHPEAQPNAAHRALAALERSGKLAAVITQNIDGLHQAAGSRRVIELHGSVWRNTCQRCGRPHPGMDVILGATGVPRCECGGTIKPDVVLYEEGLDGRDLDAAQRALEAADLLIIGGTSLAVYPAAGLIHAYRGRDIVVINASPTPADSRASLTIAAPIGQVLGALRT
jgi:NAD-dependent deacetylase